MKHSEKMALRIKQESFLGHSIINLLRMVNNFYKTTFLIFLTRFYSPIKGCRTDIGFQVRDFCISLSYHSCLPDSMHFLKTASLMLGYFSPGLSLRQSEALSHLTTSQIFSEHCLYSLLFRYLLLSVLFNGSIGWRKQKIRLFDYLFIHLLDYYLSSE